MRPDQCRLCMSRDRYGTGAAKFRRQRAVPLDFLVVQAFDAYELERMAVPVASRMPLTFSWCGLTWHRRRSTALVQHSCVIRALVILVCDWFNPTRT
jgi:hypothetical protein